MINSKDFDFSFSGLKTAVLYLLRDLEKKYGLRVARYWLRAAICAEFQQSIIDVFISKTMRAAKEYKVKTIILGGGVAANKELRKQLKGAIKKKVSGSIFQVPYLKFTTDNAAMIAVAAYLHVRKDKNKNWKKIIADGNLQL